MNEQSTESSVNRWKLGELWSLELAYCRNWRALFGQGIPNTERIVLITATTKPHFCFSVITASETVLRVLFIKNPAG